MEEDDEVLELDADEDILDIGIEEEEQLLMDEEEQSDLNINHVIASVLLDVVLGCHVDG